MASIINLTELKREAKLCGWFERIGAAEFGYELYQGTNVVRTGTIYHLGAGRPYIEDVLYELIGIYGEDGVRHMLGLA